MHKLQYLIYFPLAGDSGYPLKPWLLTPFQVPQSAQEQLYNVRHSQARAVVERAIGLLKGRWRCLDATGGKLCYTPAKVCNIVRACAVLHNMAQKQNVPAPPEAIDDPDLDPHPPVCQPNAAAVNLRLAVMQRL